MIDAYLIEPAPAPQPVWEPVVQDPFLFDVFDWMERAMAQHFGLPFDECRDALSVLDQMVEKQWGHLWFEPHLMSPDGLRLIAEGLADYYRDDLGRDISAAGPFPVTLH